DSRLAPQNKKEWAPVNFLLSDNHDKPMASIWMNQIYPQLGQQTSIFETWNPFHEIDSSKLLIDAQVERPVVTQDSLLGIRQLGKLHEQNDRRIWFCGSYSSRGIPLLESAVASAKSIAEKLNSGRYQPSAV
ncbi:MAG: NAD/FAD-binding protein, partial [Nevskiales bacterium]